MRVIDIIKTKGSEVVSLPPSTTIGDLVDVLQKRRIGAVVVVDEGSLAGIVSERDVVRFARDSLTLEDPLSAIMTTTVITCSPEDEARDLAEIMTKQRFRHLPVVEDGDLVGIVSIGDIVKARLDELEAERDHLVGYVHGRGALQGTPE